MPASFTRGRALAPPVKVTWVSPVPSAPTFQTSSAPLFLERKKTTPPSAVTSTERLSKPSLVSCESPAPPAPTIQASRAPAPQRLTKATFVPSLETWGCSSSQPLASPRSATALPGLKPLTCRLARGRAIGGPPRSWLPAKIPRPSTLPEKVASSTPDSIRKTSPLAPSTRTDHRSAEWAEPATFNCQAARGAPSRATTTARGSQA